MLGTSSGGVGGEVRAGGMGGAIQIASLWGVKKVWKELAFPAFHFQNRVLKCPESPISPIIGSEWTPLARYSLASLAATTGDATAGAATDTTGKIG